MWLIAKIIEPHGCIWCYLQKNDLTY